MHYVYLIKSTKEDWKYIGNCADLRNRLLKHNAGEVRSTKSRRPYCLCYYESYIEKTTALRREIELKNNSSKKEELYKRVFG